MSQMTVSAGEMDNLGCILAYHAAYIALSDEYGLSCNLDYHQSKMCQAHRYLFLSTHCTGNLTDDLVCEIKDFIDFEVRSDFYNSMIKANCIYDINCSTRLSPIVDTPCTNNLTLSILQ